MKIIATRCHSTISSCGLIFYHHVHLNISACTCVYMGYSDVSEHIYGQMTTTPSCVYDPLFT